MRVFGRPQNKKMDKQLARMKTLELKAKKAEEIERKIKEEEEKKRQEAEDEAAYADIESDHHGRIFVDYRLPRPNIFPVSEKNCL